MKNILKNGMLCIAAVLFSLFIVEAVLRLIGFSFPLFNVYNEHAGSWHEPGATGWYRNEGGAYIEINADGLRDREHGLQKPEGTVRIAVLGDSYAEALQVPVEETFCSVLERRLNACNAFGGQKAEVINFGCSGFGTAQELLALRHFVWKYDPDIVILAFLSGNDVRNNSKALEPEKERPFFISRNGRLDLDNTFRDLPSVKKQLSFVGRLKRILYVYSKTYQLMKKCTVLYAAKSSASEKTGAQELNAQVNSSGAEVGLDDMIFLDPKTLEWQEAWKITETLLVEMAKDVAQHNARFLIVTLSNGIQVHPDKIIREKFAAQIGAQDLFYPEKRIQALCTRANIELLCLAQPMQEYAEQKNVYLHGFNENRGGHWNSTGHRVAGDFIGQYFCP